MLRIFMLVSFIFFVYSFNFQDLEQVQAIVISKGEKVSESKAAQRLEASVNRMISQMDHVVAKLQEQKATMKEEIAEGGRKEEIKLVFFHRRNTTSVSTTYEFSEKI